jgi:phosphate transport system permease protein
VSLDIQRTPMNTRQVAKGDRAFFAISTAAAMSTMFLVLAVLVFLSIKSWSTFSQQGLAFVTGSTWDNTTELGTFQIWPMLVGTIVVSILGLIIAVPASIAVAFFIEFMAPPKVSRVATSLIDLLAALPSVVVGIWGIFVLSPVAATWSQSLSDTLSFIPFFRNEFSNAEGAPFIAAWTIAVMIIPIITSVSREVMGRVDKDLISAATALGSTSFSNMRRIVVPTAKSGILGGILLGLGRALGETVAIFFVLNLVFEVNLFRPLEPKGGNVASLIIAKFGEATPEELNALMAAGVVLFVMTLIVNMIATSIVQRSERRMAS